jgi:D-inositol-3-phosphate glycosyltransferase
VDGKTGFLIPPKDPDALAARLAELFTNSDLLQRFGKESIQRVMEYFTWETVACQLSKVYEELARVHAPEKLAAGSPQAEIIENGFSELEDTLIKTHQMLNGAIIQFNLILTETLRKGNKIMVCGNGGSAADSQHFAAELTGRFKLHPRKALPVIALAADPVFLTAWANDIGYEKVFSRQVEAFGKPGDALILISTSGKSPNLLEACKTAQRMGITCLALLGKDGGRLAKLADHSLVVPAEDTARIQEVQMLILHLACEIIELELPAHNNSCWASPDMEEVDYRLPQNKGSNKVLARSRIAKIRNQKTNGELNNNEKFEWKNNTGNRRGAGIG